MIEVDRTAAPLPEPALPILATDLLAVEKKQWMQFSNRGDRIKIECGEIDDYLLGGGFERGIVVGISAEGGEGRLISLHLLSSILLSHLPSPRGPITDPTFPPKTIASIIDTTGSFPILVLSNILKTRILSSRSKNARQAMKTDNHVANQQFTSDKEDLRGADEDVQRCLEMVAISRVFDVEGLWEVLGEINQVLQPPTKSNKVEKDPEHEDEGTEVIIIDNMTQLINELFARKERSEAHTLLTKFSRALYTQTHNRNILTLLHNTTVSATQYEPSSLYPTTRKKPSQNPQPTSIFASAIHKPALGQIFTQFPDLHLLLNKLPKTRADAEAMYAENDDDGAVFTGGRAEGVKFAWVVEVLKDETPNLGAEKERRRYGGREQRWAAVDVRADGLAFVDAFMAKGNMRGLGLEREKKVQDVGSVAKIYGFGGRRV